jgi:hypothetical protein
MQDKHKIPNSPAQDPVLRKRLADSTNRTVRRLIEKGFILKRSQKPGAGAPSFTLSAAGRQLCHHLRHFFDSPKVPLHQFPPEDIFSLVQIMLKMNPDAAKDIPKGGTRKRRQPAR